MGYKISLLVLLPAVVIGLAGYFILRDGELPILPDQYWGSSKSKSTPEDTSIRPFKINISEKVLTDLKTRLALEVSTLDDRVADALEGVGFEYGMNKKFLNKVTTHWLNKYDWRQREKLMNKYPSFKTRISGIDIHFQHIKPTKNTKLGTKPLLLLHGWPANFCEYQKIIPLLVDSDSDINFELVIPSLPGFGFSEGAKRPGLGPDEMGPIFLKLMKRLGHEKFYVQGGDFGSLIASNMGTLYKDNILGLHMTLCFAAHPRAILKYGVALLLPQLFMEEEEIVKYFPLTSYVSNLLQELGYFYIQSTKPDTVGVALSHSPSGLAAYVLEKYSFWTNPSGLNKEDGGISERYSLDELLDSLMIHWVGKPTANELQIYKHLIGSLPNQMAIDRVQVQVPASCLNLPYEPISFPKVALLEKFPNLRYTKAKTGGHLNAVEVPTIVAKDVIDAIKFMETEANKPKPSV